MGPNQCSKKTRAIIFLAFSPQMIQFPSCLVLMLGGRDVISKKGILVKDPDFRCLGEVTSHSIFNLTKANHLFRKIKIQICGLVAGPMRPAMPAPSHPCTSRAANIASYSQTTLVSSFFFVSEPLGISLLSFKIMHLNVCYTDVSFLRVL